MSNGEEAREETREQVEEESGRIFARVQSRFHAFFAGGEIPGEFPVLSAVHESLQLRPLNEEEQKLANFWELHTRSGRIPLDADQSLILCSLVQRTRYSGAESTTDQRSRSTEESTRQRGIETEICLQREQEPYLPNCGKEGCRCENC